VDVPQVRETSEPFRSALWQAIKRRTEVLERLVVELYVRGLSTRDIEDALAELTPEQDPLLSRSSVSRVTEVLWEEYEAFAQRDLSGLEVVYLFADAVYESLRQQAGLKEGVLVTWAILADGSKVLVHLSLGNKESYDHWLEHFRDLVRRGLPVPLVVATDGAPGLIKAVEAIWPEVERIRCWVHKMRNVLDKVPEGERAVLKPYLEAVRDAPDYETGRRLAGMTALVAIAVGEAPAPSGGRWWGRRHRLGLRRRSGRRATCCGRRWSGWPPPTTRMTGRRAISWRPWRGTRTDAGGGLRTSRWRS